MARPIPALPPLLVIGQGRGFRPRRLRLGKPALWLNELDPDMVEHARLERATSCLEGRRSADLS